MSADQSCLFFQFAAACFYAVVLEFGLRRRYESDWTWLTVAGGTALVGLILAARLWLAPVPQFWPDGVAWWLWRLTAWSFVSAGLPIVAWQLLLWLFGVRHREAVARRARRAWEQIASE